MKLADLYSDRLEARCRVRRERISKRIRGQRRCLPVSLLHQMLPEPDSANICLALQYPYFLDQLFDLFSPLGTHLLNLLQFCPYDC